MRTLALSVALLLASCAPKTAPPELLPLPKEVQFTGGCVSADLPVSFRRTDRLDVPLNGDQAYLLRVDRDSIRITAETEEGFWNARQTLRQLTSKGRIPRCTVTDWPSFRIRGWMMDAGRTWISPEELRREIDNLSRFKMNVFHWHLTENEAYRLESRRYPALNAPENMTRQPGRFYTLAEAQEIDAYARERGVTVIPEVDMPGHSAAFERTFGFGMQTPEGKAVVRDLVDELCETFSGPWVHIGTDEVAFTDPDFVPEMVARARSHGKKVISWNPGWPYRAGEIDMTQLWSYRGKPTEGVPAIDCRLHYLNHFDAYGDLVGLHTSRICGQEEGSEGFAGSIVAIWNDRFLEDEAQIVALNSLYPAALALADRAWRGGGYQYFDGFGVALPAEGEAHDDFADWERRMLATASDLPLNYLPQSEVHWQIAGPFPNGGDLSASFPPEEPDYDWASAPTATGTGIYLRHTWGSLVPAFLKDPQPDHTVYARTVIHADRETDVLLWFETQNCSRSEHDFPPPPGEWDWRQSWIRLDGEPLSPPAWSEDRGREALPVHLVRGDHEILIKLPVGAFSTPETRLVKWMFTCQIQPL